MSLNYTEEELNLLANTPHIIGTAMAFSVRVKKCLSMLKL